MKFIIIRIHRSENDVKKRQIIIFFTGRMLYTDFIIAKCILRLRCILRCEMYHSKLFPSRLFRCTRPCDFPGFQYPIEIRFRLPIKNEFKLLKKNPQCRKQQRGVLFCDVIAYRRGRFLTCIIIESTTTSIKNYVAQNF